MDKVILTSIIKKYKYIGLNTPVTKEVGLLVKELKGDYNWFLEVRQYGGTIQGVLDSTNIEEGVEIAERILNKFPKSTTVVSVGEVKLDTSTIAYGPVVGMNQSEGFVEPGRWLDKLVKQGKTGVFVYEV